MSRINCKILIVDINSTYAQNTKNYLAKIGFNVLGIAKNHEETISYIEKKQIDLLLIDIDINGKTDGIESCNSIYERYKIPSIFVTSFFDEEALISIQNSHAFGYILKPFKNEVLRVNILLVINKLNKEKKTNINYHKKELKNHFKFCMKNKILYRNNYEINITKNEKKLLHILIKNKNNNLCHKQLYNQIWENSDFNLNKIRGAIHRLKRKVPDLEISNNYELGYKIE